MKCVYLEAGSGAEIPVPPSLIRLIAANIPIPVIVGGGLKDPVDAIKAIDAGAQAVVVGTAVENHGRGFLKELMAAVTSIAR